MKKLRFRAWTGAKMEHNVMVGFLGAFYVGGMNPKDTACMSEFNTIYSEQVPIMQYTGVDDKDGKLIYEGDIVKVYDYERCCHDDETGITTCDDCYVETTLVKWLKETGYSSEFDNGDYCSLLGDENLLLEVIGNMYENPYLICKECNKKNLNKGFRCSEHFEKHPCCGSTDYNRHNHTCVNND